MPALSFVHQPDETTRGTWQAVLPLLIPPIAWVASLAHQLGLSLDDAAQRYAAGCPVCSSMPCDC